MKKLILFSLVLMSISASSLAQISFGIKGGISLNQVVSSVAATPGTQTGAGIYLGSFAQFILNRRISFIPELQFCQRGYRETSGSTININYVELPLVISYSLGRLVGLDLGATPSLKISSNSIIDYKLFDIGAVAGIRVKVTSKVFLTTRYYNGFLSIADIRYNTGPSPYPSSTFTEKTRAFQIGVGYKII